METIKQVLIRRDGISEQEADDLILEAREAMYEYIDNDDQGSAENVCREYFGLEPDYLMDLI